MSSVGAHLRQLREARGVSLEEIARVTRVNFSYLQALETDDHASLPVPVFTRGFIRAYCQALGEPPEQSLALYDGRGETPMPAAPAATPVRSEEHTSELQSPVHLVCRLLLEKKKQTTNRYIFFTKKNKT